MPKQRGPLDEGKLDKVVAEARRNLHAKGDEALHVLDALLAQPG